MLDAAELRRASASDADAVAQYLNSIDSDELDALLNALADAARTKKKDDDALEWRALVRVLLRTRVTRQRTATRLLQSLWLGHASEIEALHWVSEISLAYIAAKTEPVAELRIVLDIALQFVRDAIGDGAKRKALPQLLALVPVLLHVLADATTTDSPLTVVHEHVVQLLELPWDVPTVAALLELLREHNTLVSRSGWTQLRESVEELARPPDAPTECLNPLARECWLLAATSDDAAGWIHVARRLVRRMPAHMRQEAEFNMQMSLHQHPSLASIVCDALLDASDPTLALDASDAVLLLHAIRASKPLLHHHLVDAGHASDRASVFGRAQRLIRRVVASEDVNAVRSAVASIVEYGGRQVHARVWKAQLVHELARVWGDAQPSRVADTDVGILVTDSVFSMVPEVREEILQSLLEASRLSAQSERALHQLRHLVIDHRSAVAPYRQLLEDWLSSLASVAQHATQLYGGFAAIAPLVVSLKDLYNFAMVLLRKQLSSPHASDRHLAVDVWCSWFDARLPLDAVQEEEVVLAITHAAQLSHDRVWTFARLARMVHCDALALRDASVAALHRLFVSSLRAFLEPEDSTSTSTDEVDEVEGEDDEAPRGLRRFKVSTLEPFFAQNGSIAAALSLGSVLESIVACVVGLERHGASSHSLRGASIGRDVLRWLDIFVRHRDEFVQWVSTGSVALRVGDARFAWSLAARVGLGCAFCHLALRSHLSPGSDRLDPRVWGILASQSSLVRLWRKFCATTSMAADVPKDHELDTRLLEAAARSVGPVAPDILSRIGEILRSSTASGASLDGILFLLDACTYVPSVDAASPLMAIYETVFAATHRTEPTSATPFATYGEAIAALFPTSMRHLVVPESATALCVALDARAQDEILSRVCFALAKCIDASSDMSAARFLSDVQCVMDHDAFPKFRLAGVALVRKLVVSSADHDAVADAAYELLCDHVVHQLPLLRALLALSFPATSESTARDKVTVERVAAVVTTCGFGKDEQEDDKEPTQPEAKDSVIRKRWRRLRQIRDDEGAETEEKPELSGETEIIRRMHAPRLTTASSQNAALAIALATLERLHARALSLLTASSKRVDAALSPEAADSSLARAVEIHSLLSTTVFASTDISWINARTLAKIASISEAAVRIGRQCSVNARRCDGHRSDGLIRGFTSSVGVTVRSRAWFGLLRDAATQPAAKSKLSATILKLDVFLLDVPMLVASLLKTDAVALEAKRQLRLFLSTVETELALSTTSTAGSRSVVDADKKRSRTATASTKRHLVGVVPIVHTKRRKRLRSRHAFIDSCLAEEDGDDAYADLEDFIV